MVLGAIAMKNVEKVATSKLVENEKCFKITNSEEQEWDLCVMDTEADCSKWVCVIKEALGGPACAGAADAAAGAEGEAAAAGEEKKEGEEAKVEKEIVEQPIYMLPLPSPVCKIDFNFNAHGDDWKLCGCKDLN